VLSWPREERMKIGKARRRREAVSEGNFLRELFIFIKM
jgi:hypothetical protein